jgi:hypothetical protein
VRKHTIKTRISLLTRGSDGRLRRATATVKLVAPKPKR